MVVPWGEVNRISRVSGWSLVMLISMLSRYNPNQLPPGSRTPTPLTLAVNALVSHCGMGPLVNGNEPCACSSDPMTRSQQRPVSRKDLA